MARNRLRVREAACAIAFAFLLVTAGCLAPRDDDEITGGRAGNEADTEAQPPVPAAPKPNDLRVNETGGPDVVLGATKTWSVEPEWQRLLLKFWVDPVDPLPYAFAVGESSVSADGNQVCLDDVNSLTISPGTIVLFALERGPNSSMGQACDPTHAKPGDWTFEATYPVMVATWHLVVEVDY